MRKLLTTLALTFVFGITAVLSACISPTAPAGTPGTTTAPVIVAFTASPTEIAAGGSATLLWNVTNATSIQIDQGVGSGLAAAGTVTVSPTSTTTYTLTASNSAGTVQQSVTVTVTSASTTPQPPSPQPPSPQPPSPPPSPPPGGPPVIVVFDISPNVINLPPGPGPHSATMRWEVRNAVSVTINGNPEPPVGSRTISPGLGTHTYVLKATNQHGTVTRTQTIQVKP